MPTASDKLKALEKRIEDIEAWRESLVQVGAEIIPRLKELTKELKEAEERSEPQVQRWMKEWGL